MFRQMPYRSAMSLPQSSASSAGLPAGAVRRLTELEVEFISLVSDPANGKPLILKGYDAKRVHTFALKAGEMMRAYGLVYCPDEADSQGDTADAAAILRAADRWMRDAEARDVDREHSFSREQAYVAESWIVRAGDPLFPDAPVGSWAVGIQIGDPGLWAQLQAGKLSGLSLAGWVETEEPDPSEVATKGWISDFFNRLIKGNGDMNEADVKRLVEAEVATAMKSAGTDKCQSCEKNKPPPTGQDAPDAVAALKSELPGMIQAALAQHVKKGADEGGGSATFGKLPTGIL